MPDADLIARAYETADRYLALNCETFTADGATFIRDRGLPNRYDANHVYGGTAATPQEIDALLARVDAEYASYTHRAYNLGPMTPPQLFARLSLAGACRWTDSLQLVLEDDINAKPKAVDIRPVQDEAQWEAVFDLERMWWQTDPPDTARRWTRRWRIYARAPRRCAGGWRTSTARRERSSTHGRARTASGRSRTCFATPTSGTRAWRCR